MNKIERCENCDGREDVRECYTCHTSLCADCRVEVDRCSFCNGYVGKDPSCKVGGGGCGK